jgi:hypothetical protein
MSGIYKIYGSANAAKISYEPCTNMYRISVTGQSEDRFFTPENLHTYIANGYVMKIG